MTTPYYYPLFEHMAKNHGLTLTDSEMDEICRAVSEIRTDDAPYVQTWREHWAEICVRFDGSLNLDAIQRELHDYWHILQNVPVVYDRITDGLISKPHTKAEGVLSAYEDAMRRMIDQEVKEATTPTTPAEDVKSKAHGCVCPACGEQIFDGQEIVDTEDGMAHGECVK